MFRSSGVQILKPETFATEIGLQFLVVALGTLLLENALNLTLNIACLLTNQPAISRQTALGLVVNANQLPIVAYSPLKVIKINVTITIWEDFLATGIGIQVLAAKF